MWIGHEVGHPRYKSHSWKCCEVGIYGPNQTEYCSWRHFWFLYELCCFSDSWNLAMPGYADMLQTLLVLFVFISDSFSRSEMALLRGSSGSYLKLHGEFSWQRSSEALNILALLRQHFLAVISTCTQMKFITSIHSSGHLYTTHCWPWKESFLELSLPHWLGTGPIPCFPSVALIGQNSL